MDTGFRPQMTEVQERETGSTGMSDREKVEAILGATVTGGDLAKRDAEAPNTAPEVEFPGNLDATTPLEIFGLPPTATAEEIKTAWRRLARMYHPDLHPEDPTAEEKFKVVNNAYEKLSGKKSRSETSREVAPSETSQAELDQRLKSEQKFFANFGVDSAQFPGMPADVSQVLEQLSVDATQPSEDDSIEPLNKEVKRNPVEVRDLARWMVLISLDQVFNHGYGTQAALDQLFRDRALAPFMKWMGVDDETMKYFINNSHDMAHSLSRLDTPMLKQQLDHMSGQETYEFLASMSPSERQRFVSDGKIEGQFGDHRFDENEKKKIVEKLSETQRNRLQIIQ